MADTTIYEELRNVLQDFRDFLQPKVDTIKPIINQLASVVPQINQLIDEPIKLLAALKTEITALNVGPLGNIDDAIAFATKVKGFLESAKKLLPDRADEITSAINAAEVVGGLPTLAGVKEQILTLIQELSTMFASLKA